MSIEVIRSTVLGSIAHGFLGRSGGVSTGVVAGLNVGLGSNDQAAAVAENRHRATVGAAPGAMLVTPYQVHSSDCIVVTTPFSENTRPRADALVTDRPGLALGIVTADCAPVLFVDVEAGVVGAAHAGWKGALAGVTDATLDAMISLGARRDKIAAAIGPCIARASYEVDAPFAERFARDDPANERFFAKGRCTDHFQFDLEGYVAHRIAAAGVGRIDALGLDTYADDTRFFSFRRATHRQEPDYGRQLSMIALL